MPITKMEGHYSVGFGLRNVNRLLNLIIIPRFAKTLEICGNLRKLFFKFLCETNNFHDNIKGVRKTSGMVKKKRSPLYFCTLTQVHTTNQCCKNTVEIVSIYECGFSFFILFEKLYLLVIYNINT